MPAANKREWGPCSDLEELEVSTSYCQLCYFAQLFIGISDMTDVLQSMRYTIFMNDVVIHTAQHLPEAEMLQELLAQHEVPCRITRAAWADVPDFLAGGAHQIRVNASQAAFAKSLLTEFESSEMDAEWEYEADEWDDFVSGTDNAKKKKISQDRPAWVIAVACLIVVALILPLFLVLL